MTQQATTQAAAGTVPAFVNKDFHLDDLTVSTSNVRTVGAGTPRKPRWSHERLLASIAALGLMAPLIVTEGEGGKALIHAGKGRFDCLQELRKAGRLGNLMVPCRVAPEGADPVALSLIENIAREAMHPADECVAFKRLLDEGRTVAAVAGMAGERVRYVLQRVALGALHPKLLKLFRDGGMSMEVAEAMTMEPDPQRQLEIWQRLDQADRTDSVYYVRQAITDQEMHSGDALVNFVGLEVYTAHGGEFRENLFADEEDQRVLTDPALVEHLALEKLEARAEALREEGWGDVRVTLDPPWRDMEGMERVERCTKEERATAVHFVHPYFGKVEVKGPFIKRQAAKAKERARARGGEGVGAGGSEGQGEGEATDRVPESLMRSLTAHKSAALQCALLGQPHVTLAVLAAKLISDVQRINFYESLPVHVRIEHRGSQLAELARGYEQTRAAQELAAADKAWEGRLGEDALAYFLAQGVDVSLEAITYCTARSLSMVNGSDGAPFGVTAIQEALGFKLSAYFKPTAETYLSQVPKAKLIAAVAEAFDPQAAAFMEKMKKGEAVEAAQAKLRDTEWVPEAIRA